jgi:hypothetical protein
MNTIKKGRKEQIYGLYKGDIFLDVGTAKELSKKFNVTRKTVQFWSTPSYKKRVEATGDINRLIAVKIGKENIT